MESDKRPDFLVVEDDDDDYFLVQDLLRSEIALREPAVPAHAAGPNSRLADDLSGSGVQDSNGRSESRVPAPVTEQAHSVDEALQRIAARKYDLILLDYTLGARTGLDLLHELNARDNHTPVIFLTGHGDEQIAVRALKGGAVDYLSKNKISRETLAAAVRHALALSERDAAVRQARETLAQREREYRTLFENASDPIFILDPELEVFVEVNPAACRLYACRREALVGRSVFDFSTDVPRGRRAIQQCIASGELANYETVHVALDGRRMHVLLNASVIEYRGREALLVLCRDITERIAAEQEICRLNRALKALSKCSEALLRARDPQQFLDEICNIMVQVGGYRMAWVAEAPRDGEVRIRPLATAGSELDYVELVCERYSSVESSPLLVPTAIRSGAPAVCRDTATGPVDTRRECADRGFASIIALPLTSDGHVSGALAIYASDPDAFDNAEVDLLRELAANVSYGLESMEARKEREKAQNDLRASEERLRNLIETASEGIWIVDANEITSFVNAKMAAMLGRTPEEMLGRRISDFTDPDQPQQLASFRVARRALEREHFEIVLLHSDGSRIITSLNASAIFDAQFNYAGALAMVTDITEQKEAEERLCESERRYRTLFERNLAGVFRTLEDGSLLEANGAFVRMLGYSSAEELRSLKLPQMCAAAGCPERWYDKLMRAGQLVNQEICVLRKDGSTAYLLANLVTLANAAGSPEFIEGTVLDITERRQLQAQLLQSQKMDAIGQLAGGIAHDFNNLLMVMRSYAEMATEATGDAGIKRQMEAVVKAADRGAALTRQLLTFGRKQAFSPRVVDLNAVLDNMTKVLARALGEDVCVELHTAGGLWAVKADPVQIEQLILNLAVNARDAMPSGGRLVIETNNTVLDSDYVKMHAGVTPGDYVMVAVSDTGSGIAPEILPRIFEPFFTTKERGKGTGLGLATVYGIVQQCGGYVWVYTEVGQGTVFKIYLPRAGTAVNVAPAPAQPEATVLSGSETILLVEDEEAVRCATRDYLARRGYRVFDASCGEEALRVSDAHEGAIQLLITDAVMPGMSGMTLAQKMAERRPGIRILCVSGYTESSMSAQARSSATAFLQKPFSLAALAVKVRELLDSQRISQPSVA